MEESPIISSYVGIDPDPTSVVAQRPEQIPITSYYVGRDRYSRWATLAVLAEAVLPSVDRQRIHHGWQTNGDETVIRRRNP
jgi:hypothetical protein